MNPKNSSIVRRGSDCLTDTLGSCFYSCKLSMEDIVNKLDNISKLFQIDLIEGIENYDKSYV